MIIAFVDGSSKGNPGPAGYGVVAYDSQTDWIDRFSGYLGVATCNQAELRAVLELLRIYPAETRFEVFSDSEYVVNVLSGRWKIRANRDLINAIWKLALIKDRQVSYHSIPREENMIADELASEAAEGGPG